MKDFKEYLRSKNVSDVSISNYCSRIRKLLRKLKPEEFTTETLGQYLECLPSKSPSTLNANITAINAYLKFLNKAIILPKQAKIPAKTAKYIADDYFEKEILFCVDHVCHAPEKITAILSLIYYSGLRPSEIDDLQRDDFNFEKRELTVKSKNSKRTLYIPKNVADRVEEYFDYFEENYESNAFNLSYRQLVIDCKEIEIYVPDFRLSLLRNSFIVRWLQGGGSISALHTMLGRVNLERFADILKTHCLNDKCREEYNRIFEKKEVDDDVTK